MKALQLALCLFVVRLLELAFVPDQNVIRLSCKRLITAYVENKNVQRFVSEYFDNHRAYRLLAFGLSYAHPSAVCVDYDWMYRCCGFSFNSDDHKKTIKRRCFINLRKPSVAKWTV